MADISNPVAVSRCQRGVCLLFSRHVENSMCVGEPTVDSQGGVCLPLVCTVNTWNMCLVGTLFKFLI